MSNSVEVKITKEDENRARDFAALLSKLPEKQQERFYFMVQGAVEVGAIMNTVKAVGA